MKVIYILFFLPVLLYSCSTVPQNGDAEYLDNVVNTEWKLIEIKNETLNRMEAPPTLEFSSERDRISGRGGCNSYSAGIKVENKKISIGDIVSTKMFCEGKMEIENKFFSALEKVEDYRIKDKKLYFYAGNNPILVFERIK